MARDYNVHRGFGTVVQSAAAPVPAVSLAVHFYSEALHRRADYLVYLPPGYSPRAATPSTTCCTACPDGRGCSSTSPTWTSGSDNQLSQGHVRPMILVYPDGRIGGSTFSDSEWANTPSGDYESYVIDVVHNVDRRFATLRPPRPGDRGLLGGRLRRDQHRAAPPVASSPTSRSGRATSPRPAPACSRMPARPTLADNSPIDDVTPARSAELLRRPAAGLHVRRTRRPARSATCCAMARALRARGAPGGHRRFYPGGHDWSVWYPRLNQMLDLASWDVGPTRRHPTQPR